MMEFAHIAVIDKFLPDFVDFMSSRFDDFESRHRLFILGSDPRFPMGPAPNIEVLRGRARHVAIWRAMRAARKVFLHGLFDPAVARVLLAQPQLLKKCYWLIWGGELYDVAARGRGPMSLVDGQALRFVIRNVANMVTHVPGDIEHARKTFGAQGAPHVCLLYPSNVFAKERPRAAEPGLLRVLVGNSAAESNNHLEAFDQLAALTTGRNMQVIVPLSYGDEVYARKVKARGGDLFGDRFTPLMDFMSRDQYHALLATIDIAIFNHRRQQAAGNIIHLLGYGKKVFLRPEVSTWRALESLGVALYDSRRIELARIDPAVAESNARLIEEHYSAAALEAQWRALEAHEPRGRS